MGRRRLPLLVATFVVASTLAPACSLIYNGKDLRGTGQGNNDLGQDGSIDVDGMTNGDGATNGDAATNGDGATPDIPTVPNFGLHKSVGNIGTIGAGLVLADINNDGDDEVLVLTDNNELLVFFYDGGSIPSTPQFTQSVCDYPYGLRVAHVDDNAMLSIVIGCRTDRLITIYPIIMTTPKTMALDAPTQLPVDDIAALTTADLTKDGLAEIIVAQRDPVPVSLGYELAVFHWNGTGFVTTPYPTGTSVPFNQLEVIDWDGDGQVDIVGLRDSTLTVMRGPAFGYVAANDLVLPHSAGSFAVELGAGQPRIYVGMTEAPLSELTPVDPDYSMGGNFTAASVKSATTVSPFPITIVGGDVDGDGVRDLIVGTFDYRATDVVATVDVVTRAENGELMTRLPPMVLDRVPLYLAAGDIDGDGKVDLAITSGGFTSTIDFWLSGP